MLAAGSLAVCPAEHIFFFFLQQSYLMRQCGPCFFGYMPLEGVTYFGIHSSTRVYAVPDFAAFILSVFAICECDVRGA